MSHPAVEFCKESPASGFNRTGLWHSAVALFATAGLAISGYLAWSAITTSPVAGCGTGGVFDCSHVLTSHWSKVAGIPVAVPAFGLYCTLLSAFAFSRLSPLPQIQRVCWTCITLCSVSAGLAGLWFIGLQFLAMDHLCPWCLAAHTCGVVLTGLLLWKHPIGFASTGRMVACGAAGVGILMTAQSLTPAAPRYEVLRYDTQPVPAETDGTTEELAATDVSPGEEEFFAAPGELFAPPADSVFEAPATATKASADTIPEEDTNTGEASAASLLLLMAPRWSLMTQLLTDSGGQNTPSENNATGKDATSEEKVIDETEVSKTAVSEAELETPEPRLIGVTGNRFRLNIRQWPLLGDPDAKYVFVEMFDYTCPHCRNTNRAVKGAFRHFGNDLAVIALPVPLDRKCNNAASSSGGVHQDSCEISRIAVAVWRIDPQQFQVLHNWIFQTNRSAAATRRQAESLVGRDALQRELKYPTSGEYIARHVMLYKRVGAGTVPKLMFPNASMVGEVTSTQVLCRRIERELNGRP